MNILHIYKYVLYTRYADSAIHSNERKTLRVSEGRCKREKRVREKKNICIFVFQMIILAWCHIRNPSIIRLHCSTHCLAIYSTYGLYLIGLWYGEVAKNCIFYADPWLDNLMPYNIMVWKILKQMWKRK